MPPALGPGGGPAELLAGMRSGLLRQAERLDAVASALQSEVAALATSLPQPYPNPNAAPVTHPQVKTVRDNPVEPIKMLKITVEGLEKDDL